MSIHQPLDPPGAIRNGLEIDDRGGFTTQNQYDLIGYEQEPTMIPSKEDIESRAQFDDDDGWVRIPQSDWDGLVWLLDQAEETERRMGAASVPSGKKQA